jgi:hypothetical protein
MSDLVKVIYDYLNNNRHKFDEHGQFNPALDGREFWPLAASTGVPIWLKYFPGDKGPEDIAKERNAAELEALKKGVKLTRKQCLDEYEKDLELCDDSNRGRAWSACKERAGNRLTNCYATGSYNGQGRWTYEDATGQPQGDDNPDKRRKNSGSSPEPSPEPEKKPDKSEFSLNSMLDQAIANAAMFGYALNPTAMYTLDPRGTEAKLSRMWANLNHAANPLVMRRENYPEASRYIPTEGALTAASMVPLPFGGTFAVRPPAPRGW